MPKINPRPIIKSPLPFSYKGEDSEDDADYYGAANQSSTYENKEDAGEDEMP